MTDTTLQIDRWSALVARLVQQQSPAVSSTDVYDCLGTGALYVMSEEWWDPSIIDMSPRMPVGAIPALHGIRLQQLQRMNALGIAMNATWYRANDPQLLPVLVNSIRNGHSVGLYGVSGSQALHVRATDDRLLVCCDPTGNEFVVDVDQLRAPAGVMVVVATSGSPISRNPVDELGWLVKLLNGFPTIAFDTPRHPLRDWQVWHIGFDAFAVAALSAETAAPLAIVSDNVARIIDAYILRINWLQQQLVRINKSLNAGAIREAIDICDDVRFFLNVVAQQYPLHVVRRALSLPEGALIAEACRDTRQALRNIADVLDSVR